MRMINENNQNQGYDRKKFLDLINKIAIDLNQEIDKDNLMLIITEIEANLNKPINVANEQKIIKEKLVQFGYTEFAKKYTYYNQKEAIEELVALLKDENLLTIFKQIQNEFDDEKYALKLLLVKFKSFYKENMNIELALKMLMKAANELTTKDAPKWEIISARFLSYQINKEVNSKMEAIQIHSLFQKITKLIELNYYGKYLLEYYDEKKINQLEAYLDSKRDNLFTYSGLELIAKRYLIQNHQREIIEKPQEMFMLIAMHLAMKENDNVKWAKEIYDVLSTLKITMATPTMSNARKPFHQMSSCFIDTVDDSLAGIYKSIDNFAKVSKNGGGMGFYFGKVRASGSSIRGFKGAAGGVIRWIKLVNDTAIAVDQLGVRQGAAAVYLDVWHKDLPEFLQLKTNNGDDRMKAHDIFPAVCYPNYFWQLASENLDASWYMMCPHEIFEVKGYHLEDYYGEIWQQKYQECIEDQRISKRVMSVKEIVRLIIKSLVETGTPFTFNRDHVNMMNPNNHQGIIYCSNLCTEIAQNMSAMQILPHEEIMIDGESIIVEKTKPGDFVVCNLASLTLGHINVNDDDELKHVIEIAIRALDNVIDLNYYPIPFAKITNHKYRPIGLGTSGYHHMLVKQGIAFESEKHLQFVDELYEKINYYALQASCNLAKEKGKYELFDNSDFDTGEYFNKRQYFSKKWQDLRKNIHEYGLRNGYIMAIAPTSSTSIIAGTSAAVDPIMKKYFIEEKKGSMIIRVAPDLNQETFWLYKNAHYINQNWIIKAAAIRQRHIDQSQSVNLYITNEFTFRKVLNLYLEAWKRGVKTIYYVRSKSLEVEECESCSS